MKGGPDDGPRRAVTESDLLHAKLPEFRHRVEQALALITHRTKRASGVVVSFSGGKDSTVTLDLVNRVVSPPAKAVWFDSGAELQATREVCEKYLVEIVKPELSVIEVWKRMGYGGHEATEPGVSYNLQKILIDDPARKALGLFGADVSVLGLRADESPARGKSARYHGPAYRTVEGWLRLCPILNWTCDDVWAYIASRDLAYNSAYDRMAEMGIERPSQRISTLLDGKGATVGRFVYLKRCEPALFNVLAAEFPKLRAYA